MKPRRFEILFDEGNTEELAKIRIHEENWQGVVYHYGSVELPQRKDDNRLRFEYDIDYCPEDIDPDNFSEEDKIEFETIIGDILVQIIEERMNAENNPDQPSEQREL